MLVTNDEESRGNRGVCVSLRRLGDEIELAFDSVRLESRADNVRIWRHHNALMFSVMRPDELDGNMSIERLARFGQSVLDVLHHLNLPEREDRR